jgi:hypothetical protein
MIEARSLHVRDRIDEHELVTGRPSNAIPESRRVGEPGDRKDVVGDERCRVPRQHPLGLCVIGLLGTD